MGTCFGRYSCSCCNCLYLKQPWSSSSSVTRSSVMARQSSTLEFENFMYECDLQEPSTLKLQQHPTNYHQHHHHHQQQQPSISTVVRFDSHNVKMDNFKLPVYSDKYDGQLVLNCDNFDKQRGESPLLDPILLNVNERIPASSSSSFVVGTSSEGGVKGHLMNSKSIMMMMMGMRRERRKPSIPSINRGHLECKVNADDSSTSIVSSPSSTTSIINSNESHHQHHPMMMTTITSKGDDVGRSGTDEQSNNCWDHEVNGDGLINGNDLEWDDYQDNLIFTDETDSLIQDIEDLTAKALKETGLN